jgi:hypothetical protein
VRIQTDLDLGRAAALHALVGIDLERVWLAETLSSIDPVSDTADRSIGKVLHLSKLI